MLDLRDTEEKSLARHGNTLWGQSVEQEESTPISSELYKAKILLKKQFFFENNHLDSSNFTERPFVFGTQDMLQYFLAFSISNILSPSQV
jgi:hypothetical protein